MAGSLSDFAEDAFIDHLLKVAPMVQPAALWVALSTTDPTEDGSGISEPSGFSYTRIRYENWIAGAGRRSGNAAAIQWLVASGPWGPLGYWALFDASTGGNMLFYGDVATPVPIVAGNRFEFDVDTLRPTVSAGGFSDYGAHACLDHILLVAAFSVPTNIYIGAMTAATVDADTGSTVTEPVGGAYARKLENDWDAAVAGVSANTNDTTFDQATEDWGTVGWTGSFDAATLGNVLMHGPVNTAQDINGNDTLQFDAGDLVHTLD